MFFGLICAMEEELEAALSSLSGAGREKRRGSFRVFEGSTGETPFALVCGGNGKAAAAAAAQMLFDRYDAGAVISFGTAGALSEQVGVGDVVLADRVYQGDAGVVHGVGFGHTGTGLVAGEKIVFAREYSSGESLMGSAKEALCKGWTPEAGAEVTVAPVVSCDQVILDAVFRRDMGERFGALAVEMEGAAVAHVAAMNERDFLVVRAISDMVDQDLQGLEELLRYAGESRGDCWTRRARFAAAHPGLLAEAKKMRAGVRLASRNAGLAVARVLEGSASPRR